MIQDARSREIKILLKILFCSKTAGCYFDKHTKCVKITCEQNITLGGTHAGDGYLLS
jgi:hypothetical protein